MNQPFLDLRCAPCGRRGVWWVGSEFVLHRDDNEDTTWGCRLPPRDDDHLTARQRGAVDAAIREELAKREIGAAA